MCRSAFLPQAGPVSAALNVACALRTHGCAAIIHSRIWCCEAGSRHWAEGDDLPIALAKLTRGVAPAW